MKAWQKSVIGVLVLMALMKSLGVTDSLNRWLTDAHWRFRAHIKPTPFPDDILIVAIDDKSLRKLGRLRYWSRKRYAQLLERLKLAKAVGIDILFAEPDERDPQGDAAFAAAIRRHGRVVLPFPSMARSHPFRS
jgi:CHASE2 domain-containing sensor protein